MMCSRLVCMGQRELRHDRHTVTLSTDHTVFSPKQPREILVEKTIALALDGRLWRDTYRIRGNQMRKHDVQAPYLSPGFRDCASVDPCSDLRTESSHHYKHLIHAHFCDKHSISHLSQSINLFNTVPSPMYPLLKSLTTFVPISEVLSAGRTDTGGSLVDSPTQTDTRPYCERSQSPATAASHDRDEMIVGGYLDK